MPSRRDGTGMLQCHMRLHSKLYVANIVRCAMGVGTPACSHTSARRWLRSSLGTHCAYCLRFVVTAFASSVEQDPLFSV